MSLKPLSAESPRRAIAMITISMCFLVLTILSPKFLHSSLSFGPDRIDAVRGFLFGIAIVMSLAALVKIALSRRAAGTARAMTLLLGLGLFASSSYAGPAPSGVEPHVGSFTTSDGVRLDYTEVGTGPAIVFIPGWTMPGQIWNPQIHYFSEHFHVVALDPRSQGQSEKVVQGNYTERRARDIKELVDHLKIGPVVLVGWSLAVPEVLSYAEQFGGDAIRGYVLVDGFVWDKLDPQFLAAMFATYRQVESAREAFTKQFVRNMYHKPQPEEYLQWVTKMSLLMPTDSAVAASVSSVGRADWTPAIKKLDRPVLVMCESAMKRLAADLVTANAPATQVELFPDAGHALFVDDSEHFNVVLEKFVAGLPSQAAEKH